MLRLFNIYTLAAYNALPAADVLNTNTEIVITRNGAIIAELDNIEEITVNALNVSANDGNGVPNGGLTGGDTVAVFGDFTTTSLNFSTITVNGGQGNDTVDITGLTSSHRVVLNSGGGTDAIVGGTRPQDVVNVNDTIMGTAGNDRMNGGIGSDRVWGRDGNDYFKATLRDGDDSYHGGAGTDTYDASGLANGVAVNLLKGRASSGGIGSDELSSIENAAGGSGNNSLTGNKGNNALRGNAGNDTLNGYTGNDNLNGGAGNDTIKGGAGNDRMTGGTGNDKFVFAKGFGNDVITDFDARAAGGQDVLDLSAMGIGVADFISRVDIIDQGNDVLVRVDDSNTIRLKGVGNVSDVTFSDFVLFGG